MGWSWVRVSRGTSPKLKQCTGSDQSAAKFKECIETVVRARSGDVDDVRFTPNGKWAWAHVEWNDSAHKAAIVLDLHADRVRDDDYLMSAEQLDALITELG